MKMSYNCAMLCGIHLPVDIEHLKQTSAIELQVSINIILNLNGFMWLPCWAIEFYILWQSIPEKIEESINLQVESKMNSVINITYFKNKLRHLNVYVDEVEFLKYTRTKFV